MDSLRRAPEGIGYRNYPTSGFDQSASSSPSSSPCPAPNPVNAAAVTSPKFSKPNTHEAQDQQRQTHSFPRSFWLNAHYLPPSSLPPTSDFGGGFCCSRVQTAACSCTRAIESINLCAAWPRSTASEVRGKRVHLYFVAVISKPVLTINPF